MRFAHWMDGPLQNNLLYGLLPECLAALAKVRLAVQIGFARRRHFRYCVEVNGYLFSQERCNSVLNAVTLLLFIVLNMGHQTSCIPFLCLLTHAFPPDCYVDAAPIPSAYTRARTSHFSQRDVPV